MARKLVITMTNKEYSKEGRSWSLVHTEVIEISESTYRKIIVEDTLKFYRRLGGIERTTRGFTCIGYVVLHLTSINSSKTVKVERNFSFEMVEVN